MSGDLDFLYQIGTMRHIQRVWTKYGGLPLANLAEHTLRVVWIAWMIAKQENANLERVLLMALIHDLGEIRTGDVDFLSRLYCDLNHDQAIEDTVQDVSIRDDILKAWNEYKARTTIESKIVKDADILDCDFELREQSAKGNHLEDALTDIRKRAREKLSTPTAKRLHNLIKGSDPHQWWTGTILGNVESRNSVFKKAG